MRLRQTFPQTLPMALAVALLLVPAWACGPEEEPAPEAEVATTADRESQPDVETRAATPMDDYGSFDRDRLDEERLDDSWRTAAQRERGYQSRYARGMAADASRTVENADRRMESVEAPVQRMRGSAGPTPAGDDATGARGARDARDDSGADSGAAGASETWDAISVDSVGGEPRLPVQTEGGGPTVLRLQWMLDRVHFSPGVIDGRWGKNTAKAVYWLQEALGREPTGEVDRGLWDLLAAQVESGEALTEYTVTDEDVEGNYVTLPEEPTEKAELDCLCYESMAEMLAERFHVTEDLLAQLNPDADLSNLAAGDNLRVPDVEAPARPFWGEGAGEGSSTATGTGDAGSSPVARLVVSKDGFYLHALDRSGQILYHFPTTVGAGYDPSPSEDVSVTALAWQPTFHYQPKLFSDVPDTEAEAMLPAGPNSPVGVLWMQLSKDNYGIHGTGAPETIGYSTSHGCVRLTNWDATFLGSQVARGVPVSFQGQDQPAGGPGGSDGSDGSATGAAPAARDRNSDS